MNSRAVMLTLSPLLLIATVGCPHAWSRDGTIEQALERDMNEYYSMKDCALDEEDWMKFCMKYHEPGNTPEAQQRCLPECRPGRPPGRP
ncbi:hypothetical protein [Archangium violaceum]|uniref:Lipoprotein n=1 Tax=Archangium violaceum Cb vi76 TaxID=1406225 RepID=A0A084SHF9_9BACT|nr:hypothetical protein [Archangium violaceum]KFA87894.1 hypothetical protein Q664_44730 [Archangium violaceum Cb vi76]